MEQEVHMEAAQQGFIRLAPLGNHGRFRIFRIQECANFLPKGDGAFALGIIFYQAGRHVHPEAVAAQTQPEPHDALHGLQRGSGALILGALLPGTGDLIVAVVQGRLAAEEVHGAGAVPLGHPPQTAHPLGRFPDAVRPDIAIRVGISFRLHGFPEPGMLHRCMAGHQVQEHMDSSAVGLGKQPLHILIRAISGRDHAVIRHVIARVPKRRGKAGVDPKRVKAQLTDIIQFIDDTLEVTNPIGVGVQERLGVNLIEYSVVQPLRHSGSSYYSELESD